MWILIECCYNEEVDFYLEETKCCSEQKEKLLNYVSNKFKWETFDDNSFITNEQADEYDDGFVVWYKIVKCECI